MNCHALPSSTETFLSVERMIQKRVNNFHNQHGCDYDELMGEAHVGFVLAYRSFDSGKGAIFSTWCWLQVWSRLMGVKKRDARRAAIVKFTSLDDAKDDGCSLMGVLHDRSSSFDCDELEQSLGKDAKVLLRFVLSAPVESIRDRIDDAQNQRRSARSALKNYLREMGWAARQIRAAFADLKQVLGLERSSVAKLFRQVREEI